MKVLSSQGFYSLLFLILTYIPLYSYTLTGRWLECRDESNPHNLFISTEMNNSLNDSLENEWIRFNVDSCLLNWQSTDSVPTMLKSSVNDSGLPILKYLDLGDPDKYGNTAIPTQSGNIYSYDSFTTTINKNTRYPWYYLGGGHYQIVKDTLMVGGVDINTILLHELGHAYIFDHDYLSELDPNFLTLMSDGFVQKDHNFEVLSVGEQETTGLSVIYEPPQLNANMTTVTYGESVQFATEGSICFPATGLSYFFNGYVRFPDEENYNENLEVPDTEWEINENINKWGAEFSYTPDRIGTFSYKVYTAMLWNTSGDLSLYETNNRPYSEVSFKVIAAPEIESPIQNEIHNISPNDKGIVSDTLVIKVKVPEIQSSYPNINIKIDDSYVNQGDITFNSSENVWVYNWDLSSLNPGTTGKKYIITAEIDGDTTDYDVSSVYLVEGIFFEDFETMTSFSSAGWDESSYEQPGLIYIGWTLEPDPINPVNKCAESQSTYSTYMVYSLDAPDFVVPEYAGNNIIISFRAYTYTPYQPVSQFLFSIRDTDGNNIIGDNLTITSPENEWVDVSYDITAFCGQTIVPRWYNYNWGAACSDSTIYALDDVLIYYQPDMEGPHIDFVSGNTADINEDMNILVEFNDTSGIDEVTADYSIEDDDGTITLNPVKGTYNYTGTISAKNHECSGSITFKIKDSVGNETISLGHSINWAIGGGGLLTAPKNVLMNALSDSTFSISWNIVDGATGYKVYSSLDPYGTFSEDSTGTFSQSREWQKEFDENKYFYYIKATNSTKEKVINSKTNDRVK